MAMTGASPLPSEVIHVMHVVFSLQPGGMEFGVVKVANGVAPEKIRTTICSTTPASDMKTHVADHVGIVELRRRAGNDPRLVLALAHVLRRDRPHIVHTHGWGTLVEGLIAARLARIPAVVHGEHGTLQLRPHQRWIQRTGWSHASAVLSVSSRLADRMSTEIGFPRARIQTIRNGVDLSRFRPGGRDEARLALGLPPDAFVVGTVGRLVPVKNQSMLLDAAAQLHRSGLPVVTVVAGDGPLRNDLASQAAALGIGSHVRVLGHREDVESVMAALDIFVLPSLSEGLSNTMLEAMASGLPVIATRVGGSDELVVDGVTGLLVESGSSDELARTVADLHACVSRREALGRAGRQRAESEFALSAVVRRYEDLYLRLGTMTRHE